MTLAADPPRPVAAGPRPVRSLLTARGLVPPLIALIAALGYGLLGVQQWRSLDAPSWDLGIFTQLAKDYGTFSAPIVPIKGDGANLLGDHFHPILVLLAPVWWVWPSGAALLWTQALLLGASAIPLARLAIDRLGTLPGTLVGLAYALSWGLQAAAAVQFHEIAFGVPLLALSLTALLRGRVRAAALWGGALVLVKEDLGLTVLLLGLVIAWRSHTEERSRAEERSRTEGRRWGLGLAAWGLAWFVLSTFVILPLLNVGGRYDYTGNLGSVFDVFTPASKWQVVLMLLALAGMVGLRSPLLVLVLPTLAWRFTGTVEFYWDWTWHYSAILMPVVIAALLDALGDRRTGRAGDWTGTSAARPGAVVRGLAIGVSLAVTATLGGALPLLDVLRPSAWQESPRLPAAERALEALPEGAVVASDITLLARAVPDHDVQWVHGPNQRVPQCVLVDEQAFSWSGAPPSDVAAWAHEQYGATYSVTSDDGGFVVACRS